MTRTEVRWTFWSLVIRDLLTPIKMLFSIQCFVQCFGPKGKTQNSVNPKSPIPQHIPGFASIRSPSTTRNRGLGCILLIFSIPFLISFTSGSQSCTVGSSHAADIPNCISAEAMNVNGPLHVLSCSKKIKIKKREKLGYYNKYKIIWEAILSTIDFNNVD